jgi:hypothetical protein
MAAKKAKRTAKKAKGLNKAKKLQKTLPLYRVGTGMAGNVGAGNISG